MPTTSSSLLRRWWDAFLLQSLERDVATSDAAQIRLVRSLYEGGSARAAVAREMLARGNLLACVDLSRAAAVLFAEAILVARAPHQVSSGLRPPELWRRVQYLIEQGEVPPFPARLAGARGPLFDEGEGSSLGSSAIESQLALHSLAPALAWLQSLIEPRSRAEVQHQRWRRVGGTLLAVLALTSWGVYRAITPKNLALHRVVQMSSKHPASPDEGGLVDGVIDEPFGAHTMAGEPPWVMVDLGRPQWVGRVKVYNRGDGWFDEGLPLTLEFSDDGVAFATVATRSTSFSQAEPWVYLGRPRQARFLRIGGKVGGYVALSELEAYAK